MKFSKLKCSPWALKAFALLGFFAATGAGAAETLPNELSVSGMFAQADWLVKGVMLLLLAASVLTWTLFVVKARKLSQTKATLEKRAEALGKKLSLNQVTEDPSLEHFSIVDEALDEINVSHAALSDSAAVLDRIEARLSRVAAREVKRMSHGLGVLASVGSVAPFVGLFGTVWGIMNAFIGIAQTQTTSLAVVAPGIAEALLATAMGLFAAIPAVVFYNHFVRKIQACKSALDDSAEATLRLVSRKHSQAKVQ